MAKEEREKFILELYNYQVKQGNSCGGYKKDFSNPEDYRQKVNIVEYWEEKGIVQVIAKAIGFINFKLTSYGIDYIEKNYL